MNVSTVVLYIIVIFSFISCEKKEKRPDQSKEINSLSISPESLLFSDAGGTKSFEVETDAEFWAFTPSTFADWMQVSKDTGTTGTSFVELTISANLSMSGRDTSLILHAGNATEVEIAVRQSGARYPSYNTNPIDPDPEGMGSTAMQIAAKITIGWNCGNTLEAIGGETNWGNPQISKELIQMVKLNGFNAIRLPCSWDQYAEHETAEIRLSWLNRVKEVVQMCIDEDMYVVLNIHWDGGWLENNCTPESQEENNAKQKAFWEQIATHLRNFDEHLLFAGANEPNVEDAEQMEVLMSYHQTFIDAVRSTGGKNSFRVLVVQGPSTDIEKTNKLMTTMPTDEIEDKMMAEIHYYTPYQFCLMTEDASWGNMFYYWGEGFHSDTDTEHNASWGEESILDDLMMQMKTQFVEHGIPVIMGEFAAIRRSTPTGENLDLHVASRTYFLEYLTTQANSNGILSFYWDAGNMGENASALFNRQTNTVYDQQALDALMFGINE